MHKTWIRVPFLLQHSNPACRRQSMRVSDGVLDVVGSCRRSATQDALLQSGDSSIVLAGESNKKRAERIGKDKRKYQKKGIFNEIFQSCEFCYFCLKRVIDPLILQGRSVHFSNRAFS